MKYQNLYSETTGKQPAASAVDVGEIWVNIKDSLLGTKDSSGNIVPFAQLTADERTKLRDIDLSKYVPTSGTISKSTMDKATAASASFTINDSTASVIELSSSTDLTATITASKTTGYKATTVIVKKPIGKTCTLTFSGIDSWIGDSPTFTGTSTKIEYLILRVETNPNLNTATVLVNTQYPPVSITSWGSITGTLSNQTDLNTALANKADSSTVATLTTTVASKADSSIVSTLSSKVDTLSDTVDGKADSSTVTALSKTVDGKADSSTVTTLSGKVDTLSDTVDGKADASTVTTLSSTVSTLSTTVASKANSSDLTAAITRIAALEAKLANVTNADGTLSIAQTVNIT